MSRFFNGEDLYGLAFVKNAAAAGRKLRRKLWSNDGLVEEIILPSKSQVDQRKATETEEDCSI